MDALGVESVSKDRAKLEQRLLKAVSDLQLLNKEKEAYREQRHFCHVTILVSSDQPGEEAKTEARTPAASTRAKRGGAAAAPRAKRAGLKKEAAKSSEPKTAESRTEAKSEKKASKAASKLGGALRRRKKKTEE